VKGIRKSAVGSYSVTLESMNVWLVIPDYTLRKRVVRERGGTPHDCGGGDPPTMTYNNLVKFDARGYPTCEEHGAMNCVNEERSLWRCSACHIGIDFGDVHVFDDWVRRWTQSANQGIRRKGVIP